MSKKPLKSKTTEIEAEASRLLQDLFNIDPIFERSSFTASKYKGKLVCKVELYGLPSELLAFFQKKT